MMALDQDLMLSGSIRTIVREYQHKLKRHELEQATYQILLSVCSASTDSPDLLLLDLVCSSAQAQVAICAVVVSSARLCTARTQKELEPVVPKVWLLFADT